MFVSRRNEKIFEMESCCSEETLVCLFVKKEREREREWGVHVCECETACGRESESE